MKHEPVLTPEDMASWSMWEKAFRVRAGLASFRRMVDNAKRLIARELETASSPMVSWSAGKDSTALAHLAVVGLGAKDIVLMSEKDDLDYPGEEEYIVGLSAQWGAQLRIVRPEISPSAWIEARCAAMCPGDDVHSRRSGLSKACFYGVVQEADSAHDLVMLGLRGEESAIRRNLLRRRGLAYTLASGQRRANPIGWWKGEDVFAYLLSVGVEPLHVYKCTSFMHHGKPWLIRKSWWLPGSSSEHGQYAWLRRYYPSLHKKAERWFGNGAISQVS